MAWLHRLLSWLVPPRWRLCRAVRAEMGRHRESRRQLQDATRRLESRAATR